MKMRSRVYSTAMKNSRQPTNKTGSGWNLAVPIRYVIDHPIKEGYTADHHLLHAPKRYQAEV
jgi:hypothetical protein